MRLPLLMLCVQFLLVASARAVTLADYARQHPLKLFVASKDAVMPNTTDQTNNLKDGDRALLLSSLGLTDITGISQLMVEDNGQSVPITSVKNLHVFLNRNAITAIPEEIAALKNVIFLYFEYNPLRTLPRALTQMDSLSGMYFTGNQFTEIPPFVFEMTRLRKLQFAKNHLTALPPEIGNLTQLIHFNIGDNQIAELPETIAKLTLLRVCELSDNRLAVLPEAFGNVPILYQLRVRNNPLTALPAGFAAMPGTIDITGTKIDLEKLPLELRAKINTEKPPKAVSNQIVKRGARDKTTPAPPEVPKPNDSK
ncbi:MAG: leucine-rich repeat domain-containing protein [Chthoniobacter sp.]|uniref:leucine-rich repeat domain-containing protein n=1 Tax=Chthoniobacter sp. TaxID=2510640 RepID=UPI0032A6BAF3